MDSLSTSAMWKLAFLSSEFGMDIDEIIEELLKKYGPDNLEQAIDTRYQVVCELNEVLDDRRAKRN